MLAWIRSHAGELGRFGIVGIAGVFVNLGVFNLLRLTVLSEDATFLGEQDRVITAKVIATLVSIVFAWAAHRSWTFRGHRTHRPARELVVFGLVNLVAIVAEAGLAWDEVCYIGDDLLDLKVIQRAGFGVTVADAPAAMVPKADSWGPETCILPLLSGGDTVAASVPMMPTQGAAGRR